MISDHPLRDVAKVRRGPLKQHANGTTAHDWAVLDLVCGHHLTYERLKNPTRRPPARARCTECKP